MTHAVVVGAGPNGLAAAIHLARNGFDVQLLEAAESIGGGARSGELTVRGVIHDYCSAAHPMGVGSRFWQEIDLGRYGVTWKWPEIDCAHPLDDGTAGVLYQSIEKTTAGLGSDARRWRLAVGDLVAGFDELGRDVMRPVLHVPRHLIRLATFGPRAVLPATVAVRWFRTEQARALFGGAAAHMFTRLDQPLTAAMGLMFLASGHRYGWPVAEGGSGSIIAALAAALREHGGAITTGVTVTSRSDIPDADVVMLDLTPAAAVQIYGDSMPGRIKRSYRRYREGSSAFKVDFAIEGHIPWTNPECARAGMVHLGGTFAEIAYTERQRARRPDVGAALHARRAAIPGRPIALVRQHQPDLVLRPCAVRLHRATPPPPSSTRSSGSRPASASASSPPSARAPPSCRPTTPITSAATSSAVPTTGCRSLFRPRVAIDPYFTGVPGVYLCSQSTPPGAGIHGLCGYHAAQSALRRLGR